MSDASWVTFAAAVRRLAWRLSLSRNASPPSKKLSSSPLTSLASVAHASLWCERNATNVFSVPANHAVAAAVSSSENSVVWLACVVVVLV